MNVIKKYNLEAPIGFIVAIFLSITLPLMFCSYFFTKPEISTTEYEYKVFVFLHPVHSTPGADERLQIFLNDGWRINNVTPVHDAQVRAIYVLERDKALAKEDTPPLQLPDA